MSTAQSLHRRGRFVTGFAYLGSAFAWLLHLLAAYAIAEFGCARGEPQRWAGITGVAWLLLGVTALLFLTGAASLLLALRLRHPPVHEARARDYLIDSGRFLGMFFLLIILAQTVPIFFYLESC